MKTFSMLCALALALLASGGPASGVSTSCTATSGLDCRIVCTEGDQLLIWVTGQTTFGGYADCGGAHLECEVVGRPTVSSCTNTTPTYTTYDDLGICRATYAGAQITCTVVHNT